VTPVRIDDPPTMNVLGLFLAAALRRGSAPFPRGALTVDADGMRATVRFEDDGATVTRAPTEGATTVSASLPRLARAIARRSVVALLRVKVRGSRLFALRALRCLRP